MPKTTNVGAFYQQYIITFFLNKIYKDTPKANKRFNSGKRKENIMSRLGLNCSDLKGHVYSY